MVPTEENSQTKPVENIGFPAGTISALLRVRMGVSRVGHLVVWGLLGSVTAAAAEPAESSSETTTSLEQPRQSPDFLFGRPSVSVGVRGEWTRARAESQIFDFTSELLTLGRRDFDAPGIAVDVGLPLTSRLDALFGFDASSTATISNYRDLVDADELEIEQETSLSQLNLSGSIELAALPRGRAVGEYAWIPGRFVPYVGAGGGMLWYRFQQIGDFVDFVDFSIFSEVFQASGWTPSAHVFGGVDIGVTRRISATVEVRYRWADAPMEPDFVDFDPIDLTGVRVTGGVQFAF